MKVTQNQSRGLGNTENNSAKPFPNIQCNRCQSNNTYTTLNERICRKCGFREKLKR